MANALADGLNVPDYVQIGTGNMTGSITGSSIYDTAGLSGSQIGSGGVGVSNIASLPGDVTALNQLAAVKTGSPAVGGRFIQSGSDALTSGSAKWTVFGTVFGAAPHVTVTNYTSSSTTAGMLKVVAGSITAGSFYTEGVTASDVFGWMAIGSG